MSSPTVLRGLQADEIHKALIALINERFADVPPIVLVSASSYLTAGMAAEMIGDGGRVMGDRELEAVTEGLFDIMRSQIRQHLAGLPTRF